MLSVSKNGYDNEYGARYSVHHGLEDLALLKRLEKFITVIGGEHVGELYWLLVSLPASIEVGEMLFYEVMYELFNYGDVENNVKKHFGFYKSIFRLEDSFNVVVGTIDEYLYSRFYHLKEMIVDICKVMINNYDVYLNRVWEKSYLELMSYAERLQEVLDNGAVAEKLQNLIGVVPETNFYVSLCNSLQGGAEAIDISFNTHVFGTKSHSGAEREMERMKNFIIHEYIIFLLKKALVNTPAFTDHKYWHYFEALAAFYASKIIEGRGLYDDDARVLEIVDFYKNTHMREHGLSAVEMFSRAMELISNQDSLTFYI
ncbi:MAG: hypothetical protein LBU56_05195 [Rickettsiales bacterium]|jgi:hypothetical protein|nr:hypothetical protein [Rickettsiales bacterium]